MEAATMALLARLLSKTLLFVFVFSCDFSTEALKTYRFNTADFKEQLGGLLYKSKPFTGTVEHYDRNTKTKSASYKDGLLHGAVFVYTKTGKIKEHRTYFNGLKNGLHRGFWEDETPRFTAQFRMGVAHGLHETWFRSGELSSRFNYENGEEIGTQQAWLKSGKLRANYVVKNGRRYGLIGLKPCYSVAESDSIK